MNYKRLSQYIEKICSNEPVDLSKFYNLLDSLKLTHERKESDIKGFKQKGSNYIVNYIAPDLLKEIKALCLSDEKSRVAASRQNRSHSANVNGSFIIVRKGINNPFIVMVDQDGNSCSENKQSQTALLIENRQNFIEIDKTISFLERTTCCIFEQGIDVIFTVGNEISNSLHKKYLSHYKHLYCCFDLDLGGLTIANNLATLLPGIESDFLVPDDIKQRLGNIVELRDEKYIESVIKLGVSNPKLAPYAKLIRDSLKTLEQESYLYGE